MDNAHLTALREHRDRMTGLERGGLVSPAKVAKEVRAHVEGVLIRPRRTAAKGGRAFMNLQVHPRMEDQRARVRAVVAFLQESETIDALRVKGHRRWPVEALRECVDMLA